MARILAKNKLEALFGHSILDNYKYRQDVILNLSKIHHMRYVRLVTVPDPSFLAEWLYSEALRSLELYSIRLMNSNQILDDDVFMDMDEASLVSLCEKRLKPKVDSDAPNFQRSMTPNVSSYQQETSQSQLYSGGSGEKPAKRRDHISVVLTSIMIGD